MDGDARPDARLTVLTGPSWAGRDSVVELVRARAPFVRVPVSVTTRRRRAHEVDGVHYTFVDRPAFERMIADQRLLEWAELGGNLYGTPREPVERWLRAGEPVLLVLDTVGAGLVKAAVPEARLVRLTAAAAPLTAAAAPAPAPAARSRPLPARLRARRARSQLLPARFRPRRRVSTSAGLRGAGGACPGPCRLAHGRCRPGLGRQRARSRPLPARPRETRARVPRTPADRRTRRPAAPPTQPSRPARMPT